MKSTLVKRVTKKEGFETFLSALALRMLHKNAKSLNEIRGAPIAVFANDWVGEKIFIEGVYERDYIEDLFAVLDSIGIDASDSYALDVGANVGNHSIQFARKFKGVFSFEPNPRVFEVLASNTKRIENIQCFNLGLSDENETLSLWEDPQNFGASSAVNRHPSNMHVNVKVKPLDDMSYEEYSISLVKVDVEGMEYKVLLGASKLIDQQKPVVFFEQHSCEFEGVYDETRSIDLLRSKGYQIFHLKKRKTRNIFFRRARNLYQLFFGISDEREIVRADRVPKANYSMLIAVHSDFL